MIPHDAEFKVMATRARLGHRLGEDVVLVEVYAYATSDFVIALSPQQARGLADQLMRPSGRMEQAFRRPARWLRRIARRRA